MSGGEAIGRARDVAPVPVGREYPIPYDPATGAVQVALVAGGGPLPFAYAKGSGTLVGAAGAVAGYAADDPTSLAVDHIGYVRNANTTRVKLSVNVETGGNSFGTAGTTLTLWRKHLGVWAATAAIITFNAGVTGTQQTANLNEAFNDGDSWDLRVTNPGDAGDVGDLFSFGFGLDFFV